MSGMLPRRIRPGGTVMGVALAGPDQLCLLVRQDQGAGCLLRMGLEGGVRWRVDLPGPADYPLSVPRRTVRVAEDGSAWLGEGRTLTRIGTDGLAHAAIDVPAEPGEELGSFLLVADGFAAALYRPGSGKAGTAGGRIARLDAGGAVVWSTTLPAGTVAYAGVVEMAVDSGWQPWPKKAWQPRDWQPTLDGEPLLLSGGRLLARYFEMRSGLGRTFCLDWASGRVLWATEPRPEAGVALAGRDGFLLGVQGYGAFDLYLHDRDGKERQHWPSHAEVVVTEAGEMRGVEMENRLPSRMHFGVFLPDGTVRKGPHLDGYYTTYPVVSRQGVVTFWRHGRLRAVDSSLEERTLWEDEGLAEKAVMTRMLLADDGTLAFGLEDELFLVPTDLGPMAGSVWPCGGGNAGGNPAFA